jgi:hypothetical protein
MPGHRIAPGYRPLTMRHRAEPRALRCVLGWPGQKVLARLRSGCRMQRPGPRTVDPPGDPSTRIADLQIGKSKTGLAQ